MCGTDVKSEFLDLEESLSGSPVCEPETFLSAGDVGSGQHLDACESLPQSMFHPSSPSLLVSSAISDGTTTPERSALPLDSLGLDARCSITGLDASCSIEMQIEDLLLDMEPLEGSAVQW